VTEYAPRRGRRTARRQDPEHRPLSPAWPSALMRLQRAIGNKATSDFITRHNGGVHQTGGLHAVVQRHPPDDPTGQTPAKDPLDDPRTNWVDNLPMGVRSSVDNIANSVEGKMRDLGRLAAGGKARSPKQLTAAEKADPTAALAAIRTREASTWASNRHKFMDYMAPSLGGDEGVQAYFSSMVSYGSDLFVHPEVARRLERVEKELDTAGFPMPQTTVGFSARGDHLHDKSKRERNSAGMLAHAMGVAVDYFAYKNVHLKDARLRAVLHAVGGRAPNMQLAGDALRTIVQSGEAKMGNGSIDPAKWQALETEIGKEFDALVKASDAVETSLDPALRNEVIQSHRQLMSLRAEKARLKTALRRAPKAKKEAAQTELATATANLTTAETELRGRLPVLFKPWLDKIDKRIEDLKKAAAAKGVDLEQISTPEGLESLSKQAASALKPGKSALQRALAQAKSAADSAARVAERVGGSITAIQTGRVPKGAAPNDIAQWTLDLEALRTESDAAIADALTLGARAAALLGTSAPGQPKSRRASVKRFKGTSDVADLRKKLGAARAAALQGTDSLAKGEAAAPDAARLAADVRTRKEANAAARGKVSKDDFAQLQDAKRDLFWLRQASKDLVSDLSFMFKGPDVRDPGAVQLLGGLGDDKYGGGGFFGPNDRSAGTKKDDKYYAESGFNKRFFQIMASYGFEIAATWKTSDAMHFEVEGIVQDIVTPSAAEANPTAAQASGKAFVDQATQAREKYDKEQAK
jgi:hypothetical protein